MAEMKWNKLLCEKRPGKDEIVENAELGITAFERDYYTIAGSSYVRRLQGKTQVYTLDENDFVRNRLTHSMEVSSIAEMMGRRIGKRIMEMGVEDLPDDFIEKLTMVLRCAGLIHDLGNPPFGHGGERYIREYFENRHDLKERLTEQMWLDLINFDGNAQNIRIITKLGRSSNPNDIRYGMHPTYALINSIIKYPCSSLAYNEREADENGKKKKGKIGYYQAEEYIIKQVMEETGTAEGGVKRKDPIMLIMEAADDISYVTADIEDAIKKGNILFSDFKNALPEEDRRDVFENELSIQKKLKTIREQSMIDVIDNFMNNYTDIMNGEYQGELTDGTHYNLGYLKELMHKVFAERDSSSEYKHSSQKRIMEIMDMLMSALEKDPSERSLSEEIMLDEMEQYTSKGKAEIHPMKDWYKENKMMIKIFELYHHCLAVSDYVSGMTDNYVKIFSDKWHDDEYISSRKKEYMKSCIEALFTIPVVKSGESVSTVIEKLMRIGVEDWTDIEVSMILKCIHSNTQISDAFREEEAGGKDYVLSLLNRSARSDAFLTMEEKQALQALFTAEEGAHVDQ